MDYYKIGQRIRKFRKAKGLSQEALAEKIGISTTHMSHIETGSTKLSLSVFVDLANVLTVQVDDLLNDQETISIARATRELNQILENCTTEQLNVVADTIKAMTTSMEKYIK